MMPSKDEEFSTTTLSAAYQRLTSKIYANCKDNSHGEHGKIGQLDNWTIGQMPFWGFTFLGVSFLILYIYYNIYII